MTAMYDNQFTYFCLQDGYGYVVHEIGHVIGLFHEHSRYDRDDHVTIYEKNIRTGEGHNFVKFDELELRTYNLPYDYTSVMHYGSKVDYRCSI